MANEPTHHIEKQLRTDQRIVRAMETHMPRSRRLDGDMRKLADDLKRRIDKNAERLGK